MPNALARLRAALLCAALILVVVPATASARLVKGTAASDSLRGTAAADTIKGLGGADTINGGAGADRIYGGAGADRITADTADRVYCGPGRDRVTVALAAGVSKAKAKRRLSGCEKTTTTMTALQAPLTETATPTKRLDPLNPISLLDTQPPTVPQGFRTTGTTRTSISVAWNQSRDNVAVVGYRIYRNGTRIAQVMQTSYTLTGLTCGTQYEIGLTAVDAAGNESYRPQAIKYESTQACATPVDTQAPSVPQGFRTTGTTQTSISVAWDASTDNVAVTGYRIYRNGTLVGTTTSTSYTLTGLACGTEYEISLTAVDAAGNESYRPEAVKVESTQACSAPADTQAPSVPQGFRTTGTTQTSISVAWDPSTDNVGVTGYRIYRDGTRIATVTQTNYTLTGLTCGTQYEIGLTAVDAAGNESYRPEAIKFESTQACSTPGDTQAPSVPGNLRTTAKTQTSLSVAWNASTDNVGVTGYRVYRNGTVVATTTNTNQTVSSLACGTSYEISVTAIDAAGNESSRTAALINDSTSACSTPGDTQAPSVPGNLRTTAKTQTSLSVAWNASSDNVGVTGYRVFRNGTLVTTVTSTSHTLTGLTCATSYEVSVTAVDAAGNESSRTASLINDMTSACDTPNPGGPAQVFISPSGSDSAACTSAAPCRSMSRAYNVAAAGNIIEIRAGSYGDQTVPSGNKSVTFRGVPGNKIRQVKSQASNITFDGLDMDAGGTKTTGAVFEHGGASNVTLKNSRVGNVVDEKGAMLGGSSSTAPTNLVIDNVEFHDIMVRGQDVHNECIMAHAPGITIRNSTFRSCHTMDISLGRGDWWGQPPYGNVVLENNLFGHSVNGSGWHYFGLAWFVGKFENARVVNNTFENQVRMDSEHIGSGPYSGVWANNIGGGWQCLPGVTYAGNVGKKCGATDVAVSPSSSCGPPACQSLQTMPVGWVNPSAFDFDLRADSIAIDKGSATYAPARDMEGQARNGAPDAGAFEH